MSNRKHDPCAWLRRPSPGWDRQAHTATLARDRDNTKAVIAYCLDRGAFAEFQPLWLVGERAGGAVIWAIEEGLPWNPAAKKRVTRLELRRYERPRQGKGKLIAGHVATYRVPNWDYDGMDPLILREPWERMEADRHLDHVARWAREDRDYCYDWHLAAEVDNLEAAERLTEEGSYDCRDHTYAACRKAGEAPL